MSHSQFQTFFIQLALILTTALLGGLVMKKLRLTAVLGEILGGILLGPTILGNLFPDIFNLLFPKDLLVTSAVDALNRVGMLFFMFAAGLEINLAHFRHDKLLVASTSFFSAALPFAAGFALVQWYPSLMTVTETPSVMLALFIGTALSISALPVIARILMDLQLAHSRIGLTIMSSAMLNDVVGWSLFTFLLSKTATKTTDSGGSLADTGLLLGYILLVVLVGRMLIRPLFQRSLFLKRWPGGILIMVSALIMMAAAGAESLGMHAILGAFLVGIALGHAEDCQTEAEKKIYSLVEVFALNLFAPLYFVSIGLKINVITYFDAYLATILCIVACISKIAGAGVGARLGGLRGRDAFTVGVGLNARGAVEIILTSVALERHLIDQSLFVALVIMALSTTLLSAFLLRFLVCGKQSH
jgi:Kef-type K+ transport system membrane component KefB